MRKIPPIPPERLFPYLPEAWKELQKLRSPQKNPTNRKKEVLSALLGLAWILISIAKEVLDQDEPSEPPSSDASESLIL